jgi:hypothetical protein
MDTFNIFIKQSFVTSGHYNLHFEDFAALSCVSKDIGVIVNDVYGKDNDNLICDKLCHFGVSEQYVQKEHHLINSPHFIKALILVKRLAGSKETAKQTKLVKFMNELTKSYMQGIYTGYVAQPLTKQSITLRIILEITEAAKSLKELRYVTCYMTMYLVQKLVKHNTTEYLRNQDICLLGCKEFRNAIISKATQLSKVIENDICMLPNGFINRMVRMMGDTNRAVSSLR